MQPRSGGKGDRFLLVVVLNADGDANVALLVVALDHHAYIRPDAILTHVAVDIRFNIPRDISQNRAQERILIVVPGSNGNSQIISIGNQTSGKCSWYALRYARTILDGKVSSGSGMWSNGAVWSAGGYYGYSGSLSECLQKLYTELSAGKPVIVHLKNTAVSGVKRHTNRTSSYEYHLTSSGWNEVNYPHIATSAAYGHWVCVVGIRADADPANLKESDFYALDPARVSANGTLAVTRLLDGTIWTDNSPLKTAG